MSITQVSEERWKEAQAAEYEYWRDQPTDSDDWNQWWFDQFDGYKIINWGEIGHLVEVGCGPFAKNTKLILDSQLGRFWPTRVTLNDPLIYKYAADSKHISTLINAGCNAIDAKLEDLGSVAKLPPACALICINVLDHVQDIACCFQSMEQVIAHGGYLILGQDLTNAEDMQNCPDVLTDTKHPILLDMDALKPHLDAYRLVHSKLLPREQGRNPKAHYGTLIYIGRKL